MLRCSATTQLARHSIGDAVRTVVMALAMHCCIACCSVVCMVPVYLNLWHVTNLSTQCLQYFVKIGVNNHLSGLNVAVAHTAAPASTTVHVSIHSVQ
jgi:hypothetical protein